MWYYTPAEGNLKIVNYYDDYDWQTETTYDFERANAFHDLGLAKGLMTGKLVRNLKTNAWQKMVMYYDYKGRVIESVQLSNRGNIIRKDYQYRFNGDLLKLRIEKKNAPAVARLLPSYVYQKALWAYCEYNRCMI